MRRFFLASLALLATAVASQAAPVITVYPSIGPNILSSPNGNAYILNAIQGLQNNGAPAGTPGTPGYYSTTNGPVPINHIVVTGFNSWLGHLNPGAVFGPNYANESGNRIHFGVSVVSTNPGMQEFSLSQLEGEIVSTDSNGFLNSLRDFIGGDYAPDFIGVITDTNGNIIDVLDSGEVGTTPVDALYFFGLGQGFEILATDFNDPNNLTQAEFAALIGDPNFTSTTTPFSVRGNYYLGAASGGTPVIVVGPQFIVPLPAGVWIFAGAVGLLAARRRMARKA